MEPEAIAGLLKAVESNPENIPLRLHVAGVLLESGAEGAALQQYTEVLARDIRNRQALEGAAKAADAVGDSARAASYRAMLHSLGEPDPNSASQLMDSAAAQRRDPVAAPSDEQTDVDADAWWEVEESAVTLADVGGMDDVKRRLHVSFLGPLRNPEIRDAYGKSLRGGLLLWGPPGCGKTYVARALAGELKARFIALGLSDVLDMWFGGSERRLHAVFEAARRNAPTVLFFDELDALGQKRSQLRGWGSMRNVVNQLLNEMDGIGADNEGVFVIGATNHPWDVDTALLRPGRFDRSVLVLPPDESAREAILRKYSQGRPMDAIDFKPLASETSMFSGADLRFVCENAVELAMEESLVAGRVRPVTQEDFRRALRSVKPSTRDWFETARNYALFANDSGVYDQLLAFMKSNRML